MPKEININGGYQEKVKFDTQIDLSRRNAGVSIISNYSSKEATKSKSPVTGREKERTKSQISGQYAIALQD